MPVSGNEETGVKPVARQSCLDIAGVPIKKRRFIRPPSPPPEEQSAPPLENDSLPKEHDPCKNSGPEANKNGSDNIMPTNTYNLSQVKTEEQGLTIQTDSFAKFGNENKLVATEKLNTMVLNSAKTELNIAPDEAPMHDGGVEIRGQQILEGKFNSQISNVSGNSLLSLGLKEQHISALECCKNDGSQNHEKVGPISLNLSLSKDDSVTQCKMDNVKTTNSTDVFANRSKWDLNTTMDAWDGSASDATAGQVTADQSKTVSFTSDIKPSICSTGMVGTGITVERQLLEDSETRSSFTRRVTESAHELTSEQSLCLRLSPSFLSINSSQEPSSSSANNETGSFSNFSLPGGLLSAGIANTVNSRTIKSEPLDGAIKHDSRGAKVSPTAFLDFNAVRRELVGQEALKSLNSAALKPADSRFIKSEPFHDDTLEMPKTIEATSSIPKQQVLQAQDTGGQPNYSTNELVLHGQDSRGQLSCLIDEQVREGQDNTAKPTCSTEMNMCGNASDHLEQDTCAKGTHAGEEVPKESSGQVASEMVSATVGHNVYELNASDKVDTAITEESNSDNPKLCELKITDKVPAGSREIGENSVSDEEKVNLSGDMPEEDSLGSDCESDGNSLSMDIEEVECRVRDEFEDGEFREPRLRAAAEGQSCEKKDVHVGDSENEKGNDAKFPGDDHHISSHVDEKDSKVEDPKTNEDMINGSVDTLHVGKTVEDAVGSASVIEPSTVEIPTSGADQEGTIMTIESESFHTSELGDYAKGQGSELSSDQAINGVQETVENTDHCSDKNGETNDVEKNALPKAEASLSSGDVAKDLSSGINRSRIINLSRASNSSSTGKTRSVSGKRLPSHRERLPDVPLDGGKLHLRGRDESYNDSSHRFSRDRYRDHFPTNLRLNFVRGRGRISSQMDTLHGDRDSERNFASEFYNTSSDFSVPRNNYASAVVKADGESFNYNIGPDDAFVGTIRGGRKPLDDETSGFHHLPSRRRSPGGRGGAGRGIQMVRRVPRNIGDEDANVIGVRHAEKVMRGFPDDGTEQAFTRPQPPYEGLDGHFVQGARNYSFVQRRVLPKIRSKSPIRSRSPGPWPSTRRRSPDGFSGPSDLAHRRSPIYRMDRMRSPDFPREMVVRRHGSPPYFPRPNGTRELDPGRDHGHPRSMISNRAQTGRVLIRNNRRFGITDPQERTDGNEFFGGPMHSGRFHELVGDGNIEDRRRFSERRGPVRSFKPTFNGTDGENFHLNPNGGPRPFRFFQEDGSELHQRSSLREREFDGQIKNRPGNVPRRLRVIEEQGGNYRHGRQMIYDDGLDDSRVKRKRC